MQTVVFSHGKESGPWGEKITAMAALMREIGCAAESVDYRGLDDPRMRVEKLLEVAAALPAPIVLVGSSMGGHVSAAAAIAPAAERPVSCWRPPSICPASRQYTPQEVACPTAIVHGWRDDIVPVENSIRWAREHARRCTCWIRITVWRIGSRRSARCCGTFSPRS